LLPLNETPYVSITSNLTGGGTVEFDIPNSEDTDTPEQHPVSFWLNLMPTASETDPD
jgi:cytochrome c biogenesis protein ResB